ncbi:hypothetical protein MAR_004199 [Mya arenaria]|uniref:Uncharacterized protein n=1 Tax=Mya arenaria TaxID=6604 RepID=A0ABY7EYP8_MYAAR|nr:hypothetical protein MAR_004199 [Mya arenaria]
MEESVVMTGGSFTSTTPTDDTITSQPSGLKTNGSEKKEVWRRSVAKAAFDDTLIERDWKAPLCTCEQGQTSNASLACCWCYHKYMLAIRMGETPFMGLLPCATFGLRVKVRTQFGIKKISLIYVHVD